ncbi:MAG: TetR-like C-terminal domain-containing protein [Acidimicrobiia bacterium]
MRAAFHGFALLEGQGGFGLDVEVETSFEWMVALLNRGMTS